jgi:flagellar biosynthesis/type III secretory pathway M-ring protein FliF/YscJ
VIKNLVSNIAGINASRGDQVTVETLPFDGSVREDRPADSTQQGSATPGNDKAPWYLKKDPKIIAGASAGGVVLIGTIIFLATRGRRKRVEFAEPVAVLGPSPAAQQLMVAPAPVPDESALQEQKLMESFKAPMLSATKSEALTKYLRQEVRKDPAAATQLLRTWLLDEEG